IFLTEKPGLSLPTTKPLTWFEVSSRAQITLRSAKVALPIHFFSPLRTQASPSRRQVVVIPPDVAEPTRGSVRPNEPILSKRIIAGTHLSLCPSPPQKKTEPPASPVSTPQTVAIDEPPRATSMAMKPLSNRLPPALP